MIDPFHHVIDWQLRCRWPDSFYNKASDPDLWTPLRYPKQYMHISETVQSGHRTLEDQIIWALDKKYKGIYSNDYTILDYIEAGFTYREVASIFGLSRTKVGKIIKKIKINGTKHP